MTLARRGDDLIDREDADCSPLPIASVAAAAEDIPNVDECDDCKGDRGVSPRAPVIEDGSLFRYDPDR